MDLYKEKSSENKRELTSAHFVASEGKAGLHLIDNRPKAVAQRKVQAAMANKHAEALETVANKQAPIQKNNNTGLPDQLKTGIETLSGHSLDDVKVHYNSEKPAQLQAHAYAQGRDIHLGTGQEKHLAHEAWHVVQQKQGRVNATLQMKIGININDDAKLEREADVMGAKALQLKAVNQNLQYIAHVPLAGRVYQLNGKDALRFAEAKEIADEAFFKTPGGKPKKKLTREEVLSLLKKTTIDWRIREELRKAWNSGLHGEKCIVLAETSYRSKMGAALKRRKKKYDAAPKLERVNEYDSEDEGKGEGALGEVAAMLKKAGQAVVVTKEGERSKAYHFSLADGIRVLRKIRKFKLFSAFPGIHLIFKAGEFWQLYTAPRGNDFAYAPLLQTSEGVFQRGGGIDSWHAIAEALTVELSRTEDGRFRDQIQRIIDTFNGGRGPLTAGESHAVGAIICDYAAGVRGSLHYLDILVAAVHMGLIAHHREAWTGDKPTYAPAVVGGRSLLGSDELKKPAKSDEEKKTPIVDRVTVGGRRYTTNVDGVRSTGECFWDTLRHYGINNDHMVAAAATAGLTVDQHVFVDRIGAFFTALAARTGRTYRVIIDRINLLNLRPTASNQVSAGTTIINIGFFIDPRDGLGHYVPSV